MHRWEHSEISKRKVKKNNVREGAFLKILVVAVRKSLNICK